MAQPIADVKPVKVLEAPPVLEPCPGVIVEEDRQRIRRETATAVLAGFAGSSRGGGLDAVTDSAIEWADLLLAKLEK